MGPSGNSRPLIALGRYARREPSDYFKAVVLLAQHGKSKDALALAADAKVRACIYGSPAVIKRLSDFEKAGASVNSSNGAATIIALLAEMRRDAGTIDGGITQKEFRDILPPPELRSPN